jgi:CxxC motif-containing protein (DUF1111 family)
LQTAPRWSRENNKGMLGRFGWKASVPIISQQAAETFNGDIGISTTMIPLASGCTEKEPDCLNAPNSNSPQYQNLEVGDELFELVVFYWQNLAVPPRRRPGGAEKQSLVLQDRLRELPQADIHDRRHAGKAHLSHQLIYAYGYATAQYGQWTGRQSP